MKILYDLCTGDIISNELGTNFFLVVDTFPNKVLLAWLRNGKPDMEQTHYSTYDDIDKAKCFRVLN